MGWPRVPCSANLCLQHSYFFRYKRYIVINWCLNRLNRDSRHITLWDNMWSFLSRFLSKGLGDSRTATVATSGLWRRKFIKRCCWGIALLLKKEDQCPLYVLVSCPTRWNLNFTTKITKKHHTALCYLCLHAIFAKENTFSRKKKTKKSLEKLSHQVHVELLDLLHPCFVRANPGHVELGELDGSLA